MLDKAGKTFPGTNALAYFAFFVSEEEKKMFNSIDIA
jgi:hypothetical protein